MTYKCQNCGAPIEGIVCSYCHARNAIDLKLAYPIYENPDRVCPNCDILLDTHLINEKKRLYIEKCKHCDGIFLDFGEIEEIMEQEIIKSEKYDLQKLNLIKNNPLVREKTIRYKKCPECRKIMHRFNYQNRSGVIIDRCKEHGYWLDSGELRQIMEWAKLEGVRDFTPLTPHQETSSKSSKLYTKSKKSNHTTLDVEIDPILGILRKLYGF